MDNFVDERDYKLLEGDKYTFAVQRKIIGLECKVLLSDHERIIVAFTGSPFPAWVWCADDMSDEEMEKTYNVVTEALPVKEGQFYIMKYDLAEYFIKRAKDEGKELSILTNMLAYDCPKLVRPSVLADGEMHQCGTDDIDEMVELKDLFQKAVNIDQEPLDVYRKKVEEEIKKGCLFFWKNKEGKTVASCSLNTRGEKLVSIGRVYTREEFRRKHYAENLVYEATRLVLGRGDAPMLYTDADYAASNACYQKIGYTLKGKVCRIG